jgi:diaminopimelate decarboxylase
MDYFIYKNNQLLCENVPVEKIAKEVGTPCYIYSYETLKKHFKAFDDAFNKIKHITCYSVKANSNLSVLNIFKESGSGFDIVSGGELFRVLKIGADMKKVVYSGVGKTEDEIKFALENNILMFNVESFEELYTINNIAQSLNLKAPVALRVNPDVDPQTHPKISTGLKKNKFGVNINQALEWYKEANKLKNIEVRGVDCHIGSQLTKITPFVDALNKIIALIKQLESINIHISHLDIGGGLGVRYKDENPPTPQEYANAIIELVKDLDVTLILEPGRVLVANAGILVSKVLYNKKGDLKHFVIVDAAMNDLIRPSLYEAYQEIIPVNAKNKNKIKVDIVGPICESGDYLGQDRELSLLSQGEYIAVRSAGAYGFTMASNYNSRPRAAEVIVNDSNFSIIRERETYSDIIQGEKLFKI